jgi:hypothetical protein
VSPEHVAFGSAVPPNLSSPPNGLRPVVGSSFGRSGYGDQAASPEHRMIVRLPFDLRTLGASEQLAGFSRWHGAVLISIPEPVTWERVQQLGRHDNKEVHVVMT